MGLTMAAFIQEGKMSVDKDWFTMAVSRGTISPSEKSNGKDVGIGSRTHVLGDICFMKFKPISLVTLLNPRKSTRLNELHTVSLVTLSNPRKSIREMNVTQFHW